MGSVLCGLAQNVTGSLTAGDSERRSWFLHPVGVWVSHCCCRNGPRLNALKRRSSPGVLEVVRKGVSLHTAASRWRQLRTVSLPRPAPRWRLLTPALIFPPSAPAVSSSCSSSVATSGLTSPDPSLSRPCRVPLSCQVLGIRTWWMSLGNHYPANHNSLRPLSKNNTDNWAHIVFHALLYDLENG